MKKIFIKALITVVAIIIAFFVMYYIFHPFVYYTRYFEKINIKSFLYEDILKEKGPPNKTEIRDDELIAYYDGLTVILNKGVYDYILVRAEVTGIQYRFGIWSIGIGTDRKKVESVYKYVKKIIDLPDNEFGVIEDYVWVNYKFNSSDQVDKILIFYGP